LLKTGNLENDGIDTTLERPAHNANVSLRQSLTDATAAFERRPRVRTIRTLGMVMSASHLTAEGIRIPAVAISTPSMRYCVGSLLREMLEVHGATMTSSRRWLFASFETTTAGRNLNWVSPVDGIGTRQSTTLRQAQDAASPRWIGIGKHLVVDIVVAANPFLIGNRLALSAYPGSLQVAFRQELHEQDTHWLARARTNGLSAHRRRCR